MWFRLREFRSCFTNLGHNFGWRPPHRTQWAWKLISRLHLPPPPSSDHQKYKRKGGGKEIYLLAKQLRVLSRRPSLAVDVARSLSKLTLILTKNNTDVRTSKFGTWCAPRESSFDIILTWNVKHDYISQSFISESLQAAKLSFRRS